jgi:hypothetical protein
VLVVVVVLGADCELLVVVAVVCVHDSEIPTTGSFTGSGTEATGVPGGTFTVKVSF